MKYVGIDLHKKIIMLCVVDKDRRVLERRRLACSQGAQIVEFFRNLGPFAAVVEATASYEWLVKLIEPLAVRVVLAHPKKLRVIAESTRKTDKIDAQILAEFLALDMIPLAYRPTPRQREYRVLVRHRHYLRKRATAARVKIRRILSDYNADRKDFFQIDAAAYLAGLSLSDADRFVLHELFAEYTHHQQQWAQADRKLKEFAQSAPIAEAEARQVLDSIPTVGPVTIDVVLSELADVTRFRSLKKAVAYAGLAPGVRESAGKAKQLHITKEGSGLLRWALVEAAWRLVNKTRRWSYVYERLKRRCGAKKAIVAVARKLLCVMVSMLKRGQRYHAAARPAGAKTSASAPRDGAPARTVKARPERAAAVRRPSRRHVAVATS